jgi:hypothetical protein
MRPGEVTEPRIFRVWVFLFYQGRDEARENSERVWDFRRFFLFLSAVQNTVGHGRLFSSPRAASAVGVSVGFSKGLPLIFLQLFFVAFGTAISRNVPIIGTH